MARPAIAAGEVTLDAGETECCGAHTSNGKAVSGRRLVGAIGGQRP